MPNRSTPQKLSFCSRAVAGLVLVALAAACDSPTGPSRQPPPELPSQNRPEPEPGGILGGTYTLTLSASSRCRLELPEDMRTRSYTATMVQSGDSLMVTLQYPTQSWGQPDRFMGRFGGTNEVIFQLVLEDWWLEGGAEFHASGRLTATIVEEGLSGFLDGEMVWSFINEDRRGTRNVTCTASDHGARFSR